MRYFHSNPGTERVNKERVLTQLSFESPLGNKPEEAKVSDIDSMMAVDSIKRKRDGENLMLDEKLKKLKRTIGLKPRHWYT